MLTLFQISNKKIFKKIELRTSKKRRQRWLQTLCYQSRSSLAHQNAIYIENISLIIIYIFDDKETTTDFADRW